ncbi:MBL fold metallo-hydrolase [Myxococcota bacterium]
MAGLSILPAPAVARATKAGFEKTGRRTRLILLGTKGGPRPGRLRHASSQVVLVDDVPYVIDCGDGVASQLARAGVRLQRLRHIFITHHHCDHNADYGNLLLLSWASGLSTRIDCHGPPPLKKMTQLFFEMNSFDIQTRIADEGRTPPNSLVHTHEMKRPGLVMKDERVEVTAALVNHPPVVPSFALRLDAPDRSIVISGDTTPSKSLIQLARGADVLVHEALHLPGMEKLLAKIPNAPALRRHLLASHTPTEEVGKVATAAAVKTLVLSHLVPGDMPSITDDQWAAGAGKHFRGEILVGRDLMEV